MDKIKKIAVVSAFGLIIFGLAIAHFVTPDGEISISERRKLTQLPELAVQTVFDGGFSEDFEKYLLDQFPAREKFRSLKAVAGLDVLRLSDNNGIYVFNGGIYKLDYPLKEDQVLLAAKKFKSVIESFPEIRKAYYSIIPDKNYFTARQNGYPSIDYESMESLMKNGMATAEYIDIFDCLDIGSYYRTDTHWRQEKIIPVARRLCEAMGVPCEDEYEQNTAGEFYGVLAGQSALPVEPDSLVYLTSDATESAVVNSAEHEETLSVYTLDDLKGYDPYDIFLSGAEAVMTIENGNAATGRELVIFRDSFGSSLAPLLIGSYSKITLVDLRYISSSLLSDYVDFEDADVLFICSTLLLNSGGILK